MMGFETIAPNMKVKLRLPPKKVEVGHATTKGEVREREPRVVEDGCCNMKRKFSVSGSTKRGPQGSIEGQKVKRQKMDRGVSLQCSTILKSLTSHRYSWVFNKPVDPVALNIPDYFTVISQPMDLGTIKSKLERNVYFDIGEFAADVRLTFSNAMTYNPPGHDVHCMAKLLSEIFERKWKGVEKNWKCEDEYGKNMTETVRNTKRKLCHATDLLQKDTYPKESQVPELEGIQKISSLAGRHAKVSVDLLQKDTFPQKSQEPELKGVQKISSLAGRHAKGSVDLLQKDTFPQKSQEPELKGVQKISSLAGRHAKDLQKDTFPQKSQEPELKGVQKTSSLAGRHAKVSVDLQKDTFPKKSQVPELKISSLAGRHANVSVDLLQKDTFPKKSQVPELKGQKISSLAGRHANVSVDLLQKDAFPKKSQVPELKGIQKISSLAGRNAKVNGGLLQKDAFPKRSQVPELKGIQKISSLAGRHAKVNGDLLQKDAFPKRSQVPELKGIQKTSSLAGRHTKEEVPKLSQIPRRFAGKDLRKGDGRHPSSGSGKACPTSGLATSKCSICGDIPCVCASDSDLTSADISSEGSEGRDLHDGQAHHKLPLRRKVDLDSYGSVNGPSGVHACSNFQLMKCATDAASEEEGSIPVFDVQLSPKKALRAAMQLKRFSDTILKAKQKMHLDNAYKSDSLKIQQEKKSLERMQRDEKARIEAQIKAAEVKAEQDKQERDKERQAARIAIQNMERTVKIENNLEILKELEVLTGWRLYYPGQSSNPLKRLGLFMKDDYISLDEDEVLADIEEGEIFY